MFQEERHEKIVELIKADGKVRVKDLSELFGVTEDCIRKDLDVLEKKGRLKRIYGGAIPPKDTLHIAAAARLRDTNVEGKRRIARSVVEMIQEGEMVFLDVSTSNLAVAELLVKSERRLTIVTNMIDILALLAKNPHIQLIFAGGVINKSRDGFVGQMTLDFVSRMKPDLAFIGAVGVDVASNSVSSYDIEDGMTKAAIVRVAKRAYVVAESQKLSTKGNYNYANLADFSGLVTDAPPPKPILTAAKKVGIEIILPQE